MANFGRKKATNGSNLNGAGEPPPSGVETVDLPWRGLQDGGACNLAVGDMIYNFATPLQSEGRRVQAETMLSALGGVTGFAAQTALVSLISGGQRTPEGLHKFTLKNGRDFLFGDPLNNLLVKPDRAIHSYGLWPLAVGEALSAGLEERDLPNLGKQFQAVSQRLGTSDEGFPEVDTSHRPQRGTGELMKSMWPHAKMILCQDYPQKPGPLGPVPISFWPAVTAHAAARLFRDTTAVLDPRVGLEILMQSAIYGSKLMPSSFVGGGTM